MVIEHKPSPLASGHELLAVPADDSLFAEAAERELRGVRSGRHHLRVARRQLRVRYPRADLHRQRSVLLKGRQNEVWFAYRDGRGSAVLPKDRWWERRGCARFVLHDSGRLTHPNAACRLLLNLSSRADAFVPARNYLPDDLIGMLSNAFGPLATRGAVTSTTILPGSDDDGLEVDLHATRDGAGPGRHEITLRSFRERDESMARAAVDESPLRFLARRAQHELLDGALRRELPAGQRLPESVAVDPWVVLVVAGVVRLYLGADRLEPTLLYAGHGSLLGTQWGLDDESLAVGLQAVTPTVLLQLTPGRFPPLARLHRSFADALSDAMHHLLRDVVRSYGLRSSATLAQRLARELLVVADMLPEEPILPVTEQHLAEGVGSIRESIGRTIAEFRRRGWLATTSHGVILLDRDALQAEARFDGL